MHRTMYLTMGQNEELQKLVSEKFVEYRCYKGILSPKIKKYIKRLGELYCLLEGYYPHTNEKLNHI